jgi:hypothetical protein
MSNLTHKQFLASDFESYVTAHFDSEKMHFSPVAQQVVNAVNAVDLADVCARVSVAGLITACFGEDVTLSVI